MTGSRTMSRPHPQTPSAAPPHRGASYAALRRNAAPLRAAHAIDGDLGGGGTGVHLRLADDHAAGLDPIVGEADVGQIVGQELEQVDMAPGRPILRYVMVKSVV